MAVEGGSWVVERALEELRALESQHPHRFDYLKHELKALIAQPSSYLYEEYSILPPLASPPHSSSCTATTQASTNRKRKKPEVDAEKKKRTKTLSQVSEDRSDMAIRRAEACLKRIRQVKQSFFR